ncbi:hypothetical protein [Halobacillus litoralis]|uniref:hypothetical protein n=1 Tax=Halobacillus litoralis TaxID=45668 RepID=UPI001CFC8BF9|nr:hypothetical protein [Halobacillus litoralis]
MGEIQALWLDERREVGIVKCSDHVFGVAYHPIQIMGKKNSYKVIEQLWYTTYNGARQYFRFYTNSFQVTGRMRQVCSESVSVKEVEGDGNETERIYLEPFG